MSVSGIRSNRGDGYQTLVAFDWALTVLFDDDYQWIEIDATDVSVDDVVIGKKEGPRICYQCKKNEPDFKPWTVATLQKELKKAAELLSSSQTCQVRFYSRTPFSVVAKLREHCTTQANETAYQQSLTKELKKVDQQLANCIASTEKNLSTYLFLCHTTFETSPELDRMKALLCERLKHSVSNADAAFNALWTALDQLGARTASASNSVATLHRFTKADLNEILQRAGAMLAPTVNERDVQRAFQSTSQIGRLWMRDIQGIQLANPVLDELLTAIEEGKRSLLLSGLPGSGKSCILLALQEKLEQRAQESGDILPLFIQCREFADTATAQDRHTQGLAENWVENAARMAEKKRVIVVFDSLDVLSIAREYAVLTYFLAQIDRLLLIPKITVVTACREFDRQYDSRLAGRKWDYECQSRPLDWATQIQPLLQEKGIQTEAIDSATRELIGNPRELALFVELALEEGPFNVVNSQVLAQCYLEGRILSDQNLGDEALNALESMANEMLKKRSLTIQAPCFQASGVIKRALCSLNVLYENRGKLAFGHQTLLDVLVINSAIRRRETLKTFIDSLPAVPFVRPTIRAFVLQLASGERQEFRKQLRAVFGNQTISFHLLRLAAKLFAEQKPEEGDWPLLRDLRREQPEIFKTIYHQAALIEWHQFWLGYLVPMMKEEQDAEGLVQHVWHVSRWKNQNAESVVTFWRQMRAETWLDQPKIAGYLRSLLSGFNTENLYLIVPLIKELLTLPQPEINHLGYAIAQCVENGLLGDDDLWRYVASDINDGDLCSDLRRRKLRSRIYPVNDSFFHQRMQQSTELLDLAINAINVIDRWSGIKALRYQLEYEDSNDILLNAVKAGVLHQAEINSEWWQGRRTSLCFGGDGALLNMAISACTAKPELNSDLITRLLCDKEMLEFTDSYELGTLLNQAFIHLSPTQQEDVLRVVLSLQETRFRVEYISAIPCHLRTPAAQQVLDNYQKTEGVLIRQPPKGLTDDFISAPSLSDESVFRLLIHYSGYQRFEDPPVGRETSVAGELTTAAVYQPVRFLRLLTQFGDQISSPLRNGIMNGMATHLAYNKESLCKPEQWEPLETPDAQQLAVAIIDELEKHADHWRGNGETAIALRACAYAIDDTDSAARLVSLAIEFIAEQPETVRTSSVEDLINEAINMASGHIAQALMVLLQQLQKENIPLPEQLLPAVYRFAEHPDVAIRALVIYHLPYLQSLNSELGWALFHRAMKNPTGLWQYAEPCLYHAYHRHFEIVAPLLESIRQQDNDHDLGVWGRISALAVLAEKIDSAVFLDELTQLNQASAWEGAAGVWTCVDNIKQHREHCFAGIDVGLRLGGKHAAVVAKQFSRIFGSETMVTVPLPLISLCFNVSKTEAESSDFFYFKTWLNKTVAYDPEQTANMLECYLDYLSETKRFLLLDGLNELTQLMTRLFAEAEEKEEADQSAMLRRVIALQDKLLQFDMCDDMEKWLEAAERP